MRVSVLTCTCVHERGGTHRTAAIFTGCRQLCIITALSVLASCSYVSNVGGSKAALITRSSHEPAVVPLWGAVIQPGICA